MAIAESVIVELLCFFPDMELGVKVIHLITKYLPLIVSGQATSSHWLQLITSVVALIVVKNLAKMNLKIKEKDLKYLKEYKKKRKKNSSIKNELGISKRQVKINYKKKGLIFTVVIDVSEAIMNAVLMAL